MDNNKLNSDQEYSTRDNAYPDYNKEPKYFCFGCDKECNDPIEFNDEPYCQDCYENMCARAEYLTESQIEDEMFEKGE